MVRFLDSYSRRLVFHDIFVALEQIEFDSDHLLSFGYHQLPSTRWHGFSSQASSPPGLRID
jgi:hypothetical protein